MLDKKSQFLRFVSIFWKQSYYAKKYYAEFVTLVNWLFQIYRNETYNTPYYGRINLKYDLKMYQICRIYQN